MFPVVWVLQIPDIAYNIICNEKLPFYKFDTYISSNILISNTFQMLQQCKETWNQVPHTHDTWFSI